jgi:hypothetical protein
MSYAETAVLIAVMDGDEDRAMELLGDFLPNELLTFEEQAEQLVDLVRRVRQSMRPY